MVQCIHIYLTKYTCTQYHGSVYTYLPYKIHLYTISRSSKHIDLYIIWQFIIPFKIHMYTISCFNVYILTFKNTPVHNIMVQCIHFDLLKYTCTQYHGSVNILTCTQYDSSLYFKIHLYAKSWFSVYILTFKNTPAVHNIMVQ